jgi:hypothetical protein
MISGSILENPSQHQQFPQTQLWFDIAHYGGGFSPPTWVEPNRGISLGRRLVRLMPKIPPRPPRPQLCLFARPPVGRPAPLGGLVFACRGGSRVDCRPFARRLRLARSLWPSLWPAWQRAWNKLSTFSSLAWLRYRCAKSIHREAQTPLVWSACWPAHRVRRRVRRAAGVS